MVAARTIKSSRIIIINSALMLIFISLLVAQNIYFLERNNTAQQEIKSVYDRKLDVVMMMTKIVRERSLHMVRMYLSGDAWEKDDLFVAFHKMKLDFLKLDTELRTLGLIENEKALYTKISIIINKTELIQIDIVDRIQSGSDDKVRSDISNNDMPLEYMVLGHLDSLIEIIRNNANIAREKAKKQYRESLNLAAMAALLLFLGIILITKRSLHQVKKIESGLIDEAESLSWDATHDALTNVYNRRWLQHKFESFHDSPENSAKKHSLLYVDLDEFKPINDNYGHVAGDNFLCGITREFEKCIRHNDTLARMGGDEFAVLLENCDVNKAKEIADCLVKRVDKFSMLVEGERLNIVGCSIGINEFYTSEGAFSEIMKQADSACYEAKKNGKNQSYVFKRDD